MPNDTVKVATIIGLSLLGAAYIYGRTQRYQIIRDPIVVFDRQTGCTGFFMPPTTITERKLRWTCPPSWTPWYASSSD